MNTMKINLILQYLNILVVAIFLSGCVASYKPKLGVSQEAAKIDYKPYLRGTLFLAEDVKCSSLLGLPNNVREVTPIIFANNKLHIDTTVIIPTSDNQVFLATTETPLDNGSLKLWFMFPVKANKVYKVYVKNAIVEKRLFNFDRYKYNSYEYTINVIDELDQPIAIQRIPSPNQDSECAPNSKQV